MNKLEYSDIYKFVTSLGVVLITFAFLLPRLILREPFDTHIPTSEIEGLTEIAQRLIEYRQFTGLWLIRNIIPISLSIALFGVIVFCIGLRLWYKKQKILGDGYPQDVRTLEQETQNSSLEDSVGETETQDYENITGMVAAKFSECFGVDNVYWNYKLGGVKVNALVKLDDNQRVVLAIKIAENLNAHKHQLSEVIEFLSQAVESYNSIISNGKIYGVGIIIVDDVYLDVGDIEPQTRVQVQPSSGEVIITMTFSEREFLHLGCEELKNEFDEFNRYF